MIKTLSKIYQFSGKMQGTMKKAILFSVLHSLFDMMSFGALAMVFSGLTDGFTTSMIWMIFGITLRNKYSCYSGGVVLLPEWNDGAFHLPAYDSSIIYAL